MAEQVPGGLNAGLGLAVALARSPGPHPTPPSKTRGPRTGDERFDSRTGFGYFGLPLLGSEPGDRFLPPNLDTDLREPDHGADGAEMVPREFST